MDKEHPLDFILRLRSKKQIDMAFDMICSINYFAGQFGNKIPIEKNRECFEHLKKLIITKHK